MSEKKGLLHTGAEKTKGVFTWFVNPQFFVLAVLTGLWWAAQVSLVGYLVYRVYSAVAA